MLHFLDRSSLDSVQLVSKELCVVVKRNSKSLPLRYVQVTVRLFTNGCHPG